MRGPYLQRPTPESIVVRWRTDTPTTSRVRYGTRIGALGQSVADGALVVDHELELSGLSAETTYFYAVGTQDGDLSGDDAATFFVTPPPPGVDRRTRLWVIGDSGTGNAQADAVRDAYLAATGSKRTDLWLLLGDNAYPSGTDTDYQGALFETYPALLRSVPTWPTLGNHDGVSADSDTQTGPYYEIFTLPTLGEAGGLASGTEAFYSFDHGKIHFVVLDSHDSSVSPVGAMLAWLEADLQATVAEWLIAFWHHPPYTKGSHDSDAESQLIAMRENVLPLLEAYGVDLVLAGHSHSYERSFLLDGHYGDSASLIPAMLLDPGSGRENETGAYAKPTAGQAAHEGAVYAVVGSSGRVSAGVPLDHPAMFLGLGRLGSLILEIDGRRLDAAFLSELGETLDTFTLRKGDGALAAMLFVDSFERGDAERWSRP